MAHRQEIHNLPGECQVLGAKLRCVIAPNPSPMTHWGTNTYIIGMGEVAVIDPGPDIASHQSAILAALLPGERISHILLTHAHLDHSRLAQPLASATGARTYAFGAANTGRRDFMQKIAEAGMVGGGEGVDQDFEPQIRLRDGEQITNGNWTVRAIHTPGHMSNHLCFAIDDWLFSGDHIMGWASSLVSPPDGDMSAYMASIDRLATEHWSVAFPGHGPQINDVAGRITDLHAHRKARENAILDVLRLSPARPEAIAVQVYGDLPATMFAAAKRNVVAHLVDLVERGTVLADPQIDADATFSIA